MVALGSLLMSSDPADTSSVLGTMSPDHLSYLPKEDLNHSPPGSRKDKTFPREAASLSLALLDATGLS